MSTRVLIDDVVYILKSDLLGQGETSRVFPGYNEKQSSSENLWAVKLAKDINHNGYIEREFETLQTLRETILAMPRGARAFPEVIPLPESKLGTVDDNRKALVMQPLLTQSLLSIFENLTDPLAQQQLVLTAARQYGDLLQALTRAELSCQDRKLNDLWWEGSPETGHLVVTDWNVMSDTVNPALDLRRFGLMWFELLIGSQMPSDFQPRREDYEQIQDKISYGLWVTLARSLGSSIGPQFCHSHELVEFLEALGQFADQSPQKLTQQARKNLTKAQTHLDRGQADWAWIQFDMAQRLDNNHSTTGLEQAQQWALDPVAQAAPGLVRKLTSPQFSEIEDQLRELQNKVQRPQELGEVNRAQFGFDLLNTIKEALITDSATSGLAEAAQNFAQAQEILVEGVLRPLSTQDGETAHKNLEKLTHLLDEEGIPSKEWNKLGSLERETRFWLEFDHVQRTLYDQPEQTISPLKQCKTLRPTIEHWPDPYEPTLNDLDRLQDIVDANLRSAILAGDVSPSAKIPASDSLGDHLNRQKEEMDKLDEQADRFLIITQILEDRKQDLKETLEFYNSLTVSTMVHTQTFFTNALRLYLATAQAQMEEKKNTNQSLTRAEALLEHVKPILPPEEWQVYQGLYQHLVELVNGESS